MASLDSDPDSELNILSAFGIDKAFNYLVRMRRDRKITDHLENHPAAYEEIVTDVEEIPRPKHLPTPASIPCHTDSPSEHVSLSQRITQGKELDPYEHNNQHRNLIVEPPDYSFPTVQQEPSHHTDVKNTDKIRNRADERPFSAFGEPRRLSSV